MGKIALQQVFDRMSDDQFELIRTLKDETLSNKRFARAQRRRLERNWRKYAEKHEQR